MSGVLFSLHPPVRINCITGSCRQSYRAYRSLIRLGASLPPPLHSYYSGAISPALLFLPSALLLLQCFLLLNQLRSLTLSSSSSSSSLLLLQSYLFFLLHSYSYRAYRSLIRLRASLPPLLHFYSSGAISPSLFFLPSALLLLQSLSLLNQVRSLTSSSSSFLFLWSYLSFTPFPHFFTLTPTESIAP